MFRTKRNCCDSIVAAHKKPEYLAVNLMGKIPTIKHGDTVITEAAAICAYLADAFPAANLAPPTEPHRARHVLSLDVFRRRLRRAGDCRSHVCKRPQCRSSWSNT